jgi:hypothetical protein
VYGAIENQEKLVAIVVALPRRRAGDVAPDPDVRVVERPKGFVGA